MGGKGASKPFFFRAQKEEEEEEDGRQEGTRNSERCPWNRLSPAL
jgi:hypothetical protein